MESPSSSSHWTSVTSSSSSTSSSPTSRKDDDFSTRADAGSSAMMSGDAGLDAGPSTPTPPRECWICRGSASTPTNPIITRVCFCSGTIGAVHQRCIDSWVLQHNHLSCPSCGVPYSVKHIARTPVEFPSTRFGLFWAVLWFYLLPLLGRVLKLVAGVLAMWVVLPLCVGVAYHGSVELGWWEWLDAALFGVAIVGFYRSVRTAWGKWLQFFEETGSPFLVSANTATAAVEEEGEDEEDNEMAEYDFTHTAGVAGNGGRGHAGAGAEGEEEEDIVDDDSDYSQENIVANVFRSLDSTCTACGVSRDTVPIVAKEFAHLMLFAGIFSLPYVKPLLLVCFAAGSVYMRKVRPPKKINNPRRRHEEVAERKGEATDADIKVWFATFVCEIFLFSILMPMLSGVTLYISTAPYFCQLPASFSDFFLSMTMTYAASFWVVGMLCYMVLMAMEANIMVPLFAPGLNLFFIRSMDARYDVEGLYWHLVFSQVFDSDSLTMARDFLHVATCEVVALFFFMALPLRAIFGIREWVFGDVSNNRIPMPLPLGLPLTSGASISGWINSTAPLTEWLTHESSKLLASYPGGSNALFSSWQLGGSDDYEMAQLPVKVARGFKLAQAVAQSRNDTSMVAALSDASSEGLSVALPRLLWACCSAGYPLAMTLLDAAEKAKRDADTSRIVDQLTSHRYMSSVTSARGSSGSSEPVDAVGGGVTELLTNATTTTPRSMVSFDDAVGQLAIVVFLWTHRIPVIGSIGLWCATKMLYHPQIMTAFLNVHLMLLIFALVACFARFRFQRIQLKVLRPVAIFMGRHIVRMENFLFDQDRLAFVDLFLRNPDIEDLDMPPLPIHRNFLRRERAVPEDQIPSCLRLRLFVFTVFFFITGCLLFWTLPAIFMTLMLSGPTSSCVLVVLPWVIIFLLWDPMRFGENIILASLVGIVLVAGTLMEAWETCEHLMILSPRKMVRETRCYVCNVTRKVVPFSVEVSFPRER